MDVKQSLVTAIADLDEKKAIHLMKEFIANNPPQAEIDQAISACQEGMSEVGNRFEAGDYFLAELIYSAEILKELMKLMQSQFELTGKSVIGKVLLGTAKGDIHDIGKNIVKNLLEAGGFEVCDLGVDVSAGQFVNKIKETEPNIVGISGLITPTIESMKTIVDTIKASGLKENIKIIIGGNLVSQVIADHIGADGFSRSAPKGVQICKKWVGALE